MLRTLRAALAATLGLMVLTGLMYPLAVTGVCQLLLPRTANGSLAISANGTVVGSELIGQAFADPKYFWGRPSSAGGGYDPQASGPSNLGPTSQKLADSFKVEAVKARADGVAGLIAGDRLTGSGSGLDPDISLENALEQSARVAKARGLGEEAVGGIVLAHVEARTWGLFGEPRVNVLAVNRALDGDGAPSK